MDLIQKKYTKHHSFNSFYARQGDLAEKQVSRAMALLHSETSRERVPGVWHPLLKSVERDLLSKPAASLPDASENGTPAMQFKITQFIAEEMNLLEDEQIPEYLVHRYRYDVYPAQHILDEYPPYLQIEPASICNFRCVFCYQTDPSFSGKAGGYMGTMDLATFQQIVDRIEGHIHFLSLASRGEPLVCKDISAMLRYSAGKFLSLKLNTNASLLREDHVHAILAGGVRTVVFSADAASEPMYSTLRVNGSLDRTLKNIEMFQKIRQTQYPNVPIISRVSGVKVNDDQDLESMVSVWGSLVDQVAFVNYNPWENIYESPANEQKTPCSDLWRRMFVWYDGSVNPCDSDYKSSLGMGRITDASISGLWTGDRYNALRAAHLGGNRQQVEPCRRCAVV